MASTTVGMVKETTPGERRVALVPDVAAQLSGSGMKVLVEADAGMVARCPDQAFAAAGATIAIVGGLAALAATKTLVT